MSIVDHETYTPSLAFSREFFCPVPSKHREFCGFVGTVWCHLRQLNLCKANDVAVSCLTVEGDSCSQLLQLTRDCTFANKILESGGQLVHRISFTLLRAILSGA